MIDLIPHLHAFDIDVDYSEAVETTKTVIDVEKPEFTGILDQWGNPVPYPKIKMGFRR